jgi:hypothetical protein
VVLDLVVLVVLEQITPTAVQMAVVEADFLLLVLLVRVQELVEQAVRAEAVVEALVQTPL